MNPNADDLIQALKKVRWSPSSGTSLLLSQYGIDHGFIGVDAQARVTALGPNHVKQVHGIEVIPASEKTTFKSDAIPNADGVYSKGSSTVAVKTADCLPVLAATKSGQWVAALHAGWRGFSSGILLRALEIAPQTQSRLDLIFAIGPSISRERFEVGPEVIDALCTPVCGLSEIGVALSIAKGRKDRWHVDLQMAAALQLILAGVAPESIEVIQACTFSDRAQEQFLWNSYRRDGKGCGSNWSWIRGR